MQDSQFSATGLVLLGELAKINKNLAIFDVNNAGFDGLNRVLDSTNLSRLHLQQPMEDVGEFVEREPSVSVHSQCSQVHLSVLEGIAHSKDLQPRSFFEAGPSCDENPTRSTKTTVLCSTQSQTRMRNQRKTPSNAIDQLFQGLP